MMARNPLSGRKAQERMERLKTWAAEFRIQMIEALTMDTPYRAQPLSKPEQLSQFMSVTPEDFEAMIFKLNEKYRGLPDAYERVNADLAKYISSMMGLMLESGMVRSA